jgi:hypothetical protein
VKRLESRAHQTRQKDKKEGQHDFLLQLAAHAPRIIHKLQVSVQLGPLHMKSASRLQNNRAFVGNQVAHRPHRPRQLFVQQYAACEESKTHSKALETHNAEGQN